MGAAILLALLLPATALAHPERPSFYPNFNRSSGTFGPHFGSVPQYRTTGPAIVVCKSDSERRLRNIFGSRTSAFRTRQALLRQCRFQHAQTDHQPGHDWHVPNQPASEAATGFGRRHVAKISAGKMGRRDGGRAGRLGHGLPRRCLEFADQPIDFVHRVICMRADSHASRPAADDDASRFQTAADVVRIAAGQLKRDDPGAVLSLARG